MQKRIYVSEEDAATRAALCDFLSSYAADWEVTRFDRPSHLIEACGDHTPDAVLVDLHLADRTLPDLLEQIRSYAPTTLRVGMGKHLPSAMNATASSAHVYLCKPFAFEELGFHLQRGFRACARLSNPQIAGIVLALRGLPVLPKVYFAVAAAIDQAESNLRPVVDLLAKDPGLSTTLLRLANSPLFSSHLVSDLMQAVMILGTERVKAIVVSHAVLERYQNLRQPVSSETLWAHSCHTAVLARRLCAQLKLEATLSEAAFLGGLLHNTGRLVLLDNFPDEYRKALAARIRPAPLAQIERSLLYASGEDVTAFLLELWGMASQVVTAAAWHENPWDEPGGEGFRPATAVYLANILAHQLHPTDASWVNPVDLTYLRGFSGTESLDLEQIKDQAVKEHWLEPLA